MGDTSGRTRPAVDHLVYASPDVDASVADLERRLGAKAAPGGRHPRWGTRNALIGLGERVYLEIVGPDRDAPPDGERPFGIDRLDRPRLVTWAAAASDLLAVAERARGLGVDLGEVLPGSRVRPDGIRLTWTLTDPAADREGGLVPFFIDWGDTPHPAASAPAGCRLIDLRAEHPEPDRLRRILSGLDLDVPVERGNLPVLVATIAGPSGTYELR